MENEWQKQLQELNEQLDSIDADIEKLNKLTQQLIIDAMFFKVVLENEDVFVDEGWNYDES